MTRLNVTRFLISNSHMHRKLFIILCSIPFSRLGTSYTSRPFRSLRTIRKHCFSFKFTIAFAFSTRLLLALRPITSLGEPYGCLVELSFTFVDWLAVRHFDLTSRLFFVGFTSEEQCRLDIYFSL